MNTQRQKTILKNLPKVLAVLKEEARQWKEPVAGTFAHGENAVFKVLISTVLSLRTKDATTQEASHRLFASADNPAKMLQLSASEIERLIYPVGFYRTKAKNVLGICRTLLEKFAGRVPDDLDTLLSLKGVGRKTANLVVTVGFRKPGICVDTHVHRICNRWGLVKTKTPAETEKELRRVLPARHWVTFNGLLVAYGQNLCVPVSPFCSRCRIYRICPRLGVQKNR